MGISEVEGKFDKFDGTIGAAEDDFSDAQYEMAIEVPSINTGVEMRDNHLRSPDFFDAEKYPEMTFKSTSSKSWRRQIQSYWKSNFSWNNKTFDLGCMVPRASEKPSERTGECRLCHFRKCKKVGL